MGYILIHVPAMHRHLHAHVCEPLSHLLNFVFGQWAREKTSGLGFFASDVRSRWWLPYALRSKQQILAVPFVMPLQIKWRGFYLRLCSPLHSEPFVPFLCLSNDTYPTVKWLFDRKVASSLLWLLPPVKTFAHRYEVNGKDSNNGCVDLNVFC